MVLNNFQPTSPRVIKTPNYCHHWADKSSAHTATALRDEAKIPEKQQFHFFVLFWTHLSQLYISSCHSTQEGLLKSLDMMDPRWIWHHVVLSSFVSSATCFHLILSHLHPCTVQPIWSTFLDGLHSSKSLSLKCDGIYIVLILWCIVVHCYASGQTDAAAALKLQTNCVAGGRNTGRGCSSRREEVTDTVQLNWTILWIILEFLNMRWPV